MVVSAAATAVNTKTRPSLPIPEFDCIIVGAGPAGLACLSGVQEPYSLDHLSEGQLRYANRHLPNCKGRSVAVIDPHPEWMEGWSKNFATLNIQHLRSPCMAHPDLFDKNALLAYAESHGRQDELLDSGCSDCQQHHHPSRTLYNDSQLGLWKLASASLFQDFCQDMARRLSHSYIQGHVVDIDREKDGGPLLEVTLGNGDKVRAADVILGMGVVGRPIVPGTLAKAPRMMHWSSMEKDVLTTCKKVLVVGGGLTAVQTAQRVVKDTPHLQVTLCTRRPLQERHFDLDMEWFDRRTSNKCMFDFYHQSEDDRLAILKKSRDGGSVPGSYMRELRTMERAGQVVRVVGNAALERVSGSHQQSVITFGNGMSDTFDAVILACGMQPDCENHALCKKLLERWPLRVVGGFPAVTEDLVWTQNLYVIGSLGSLNMGPDAANLMGIRRGAEIIANAMECRCWLRQESVLKNQYWALEELSSDDSSEEED